MRRKFADGSSDGRERRSKCRNHGDHPGGSHYRGEGGDILPHGWLECPAYGEPIGCIIPSKIPLGEFHNQYIPAEKRYTPRDALSRQELLGRRIGLVIDLTNSDRYYSRSAWLEEGIDHVKIRCIGRDSVPEEESVEKFVEEVNRFCSQLAHQKKYILVHCTHGYNRTGYMIAHYLKFTELISITEAVDRFAKARRPGIYKQDYIDSLYMIHQEQKPAKLAVCPRTPEWKRPSDHHHQELKNDEAILLKGSHVRGDGLMTNDDLLGDVIPYDQQEALRLMCYLLLQLGVPARGNAKFPGSHPVSLDRSNIRLLKQSRYSVTWKADGTRYMMFITGDGSYLIDRKFEFRRINMRFPCKYTNIVPEQFHHNTLLDGEMVIDTDPNTKTQRRRYLVYDLMAINGTSVAKLPFHRRWELIEEEVIQPRNSERDALSKSIYPYYRYDSELFSVRRKGFWPLSTVQKLLKEFIPSLSHGADGLIFQAWDDPYVCRTNHTLLKWRYQHMNSVDFHFVLGRRNKGLLYLNERGKLRLMEEDVLFSHSSDACSCSSRIIECSWDSRRRMWVFMRIRTDKSSPNEYSTYRKIKQSMADNITEEVLLKEINSER